MNAPSTDKGFSLFELMIAVAVIGIVSAVAVPAYQAYIDTANMTRVTASFEEGVRLAANTFTRRKSRVQFEIVFLADRAQKVCRKFDEQSATITCLTIGCNRATVC